MIEIGTSNMIALCHIVDDFKDFEKKLIPIMSIKHYGVFAYQLGEISKGKFAFGALKAKKFYSENKSIIDTINKYSNITNFITQCYSGSEKTCGTIEEAYKYIIVHKDEKEKILAVLEKLKELGFDRFGLNDGCDFTKKKYYINAVFSHNFEFSYVDNIEAIPNYGNDVYYTTRDSNYLMTLCVFEDVYCRKILLNSLVFDPKRLPECLTKKNTFDYILSLNEKQKAKSDIITNSVDLSVCVYDLENQLKSAIEIIDRLYGIKNKKEIIQITSIIRDNVEKLKALNEEHNDSAVKQDPQITKEVLENERQLYLKRRSFDNIDFD